MKPWDHEPPQPHWTAAATSTMLMSQGKQFNQDEPEKKAHKKDIAS